MTTPQILKTPEAWRRYLAWACAGLLLTATTHAEVARGRDGMVASVHPLATEAGVAALERGGNAIDAAVAVGLTLAVVDGHNSGLGGGCFMLIRRADGEIVALDGREMAPAAATRDMFVREGKGDPKLSQTGALASGIPGSLAVYDFAVQNYGARPLAEALRPAAELAEKGHVLSKPAAARLASVKDDFWRCPAARPIYFHADGTPLGEGELLVQRDLGASLRALAENGIAWFYQSPFPQRVEQWMKENGGITTAADYAHYTLRQREPIRTTYRGYEIVSFPPPSSGGVHVAEILNLLEPFDLAKLSAVDRIHVMADAMNLAFADRAYWLGDPDFTPVPRGLVDKGYAASLSRKIQPGGAALEVPAHGEPPAAATDVFGKHTTHFCTADAQGNWVACTATVNTTYGSKVVVPGTGIVLNNQMDDFSIQPGVANAFGLVGGEANAVAPGKRPLSSMSPTLVLKDGRPLLSAGAAGGPTIISQTVLNLVGVLDLHLPLDEAIRQPRVHHQWSPPELKLEKTTAPEIVTALQQRGHLVVLGGSSAANLIALDEQTGGLLGASEPRLPSKAAGFSKAAK